MKTRKPGERPAFLAADNAIQLLVPVTYNVGAEAERVTELQLRRLTAAEMMILDEPLPYTKKLLGVIESMTGLVRVVTLKLDAVDLDRVDEALGYFREPGSVTGATS